MHYVDLLTWYCEGTGHCILSWCIQMYAKNKSVNILTKFNWSFTKENIYTSFKNDSKIKFENDDCK